MTRGERVVIEVGPGVMITRKGTRKGQDNIPEVVETAAPEQRVG